MANRADRRKHDAQARTKAVLRRQSTNGELLKLVKSLSIELDSRAELCRAFIDHNDLGVLLLDEALDPLIHLQLPNVKDEALPEIREILRGRLYPKPVEQSIA